ncbi:hypothetical protein [Actinokineospora iranica]|uniref:Uncharacterized protein n=1 Tax=Actinokineospora iranica TaxID=1271860 RepID=A0A1G6S157_9PSEU|nr:hypothetical protein [Actinokineospora iranica]SDD10403.1 hypothetical protein SAMN05216174_107148 [Actinokineospora iranica]
MTRGRIGWVVATLVAASACTAGVPGAPIAAPISAPTTSVPRADVAACADGDCEVTVTAAAVIAFEPRLRVGELTVRSIERNVVTLQIPMIGGAGFGCAGPDCSSTITGADEDGQTTGRASTRPGGRVTANGVAVEVLSVADGAAVLRISPTA